MLVTVLGTASDVVLRPRSGSLLGLAFGWLGKAGGFVGWCFLLGARLLFLLPVFLHLNKLLTRGV